jgi:hypothetical protein
MLCCRLLRWPASESGKLCHGDGAYGQGDRAAGGCECCLGSPASASTKPDTSPGARVWIDHYAGVNGIILLTDQLIRRESCSYRLSRTKGKR